jgi:hypothetical protein
MYLVWGGKTLERGEMRKTVSCIILRILWICYGEYMSEGCILGHVGFWVCRRNGVSSFRMGFVWIVLSVWNQSHGS